MAFADNLPISESLGVFVGVAGLDWLVDGQAEPIRAALAAVAVGGAIFVTRRWLKSRRKDGFPFYPPRNTRFETSLFPARVAGFFLPAHRPAVPHDRVKFLSRDAHFGLLAQVTRGKRTPVPQPIRPLRPPAWPQLSGSGPNRATRAAAFTVAGKYRVSGCRAPDETRTFASTDPPKAALRDSTATVTRDAP